MTSVETIVNKYWEDGNNCSICTAAGVLTYYKDPDLKKILRMLNGFDNTDHENTLCGAILGIYLTMSKILGNYDLSEKEIKLRLGQFRHEFIRIYKSINCHTIMKNFGETTTDTTTYNTIPRCSQLLLDSVKIALIILNWDSNPLIPVERRFELI